MDVVFVRAFSGIKPRMGPIGHRMERANGDRLGQHGIDRIGKFFNVKTIVVEVRKLLPRVNAGIGTAGAGECYRGAQNHRQRFFERALYRDGIGLFLPAAIGCAVIGKFDEVSQGSDFLTSKDSDLMV